jgi:hypothetical protein
MHTRGAAHAWHRLCTWASPSFVCMQRTHTTAACMTCASVAFNVWGGRQSSLQARGVVLTSGLSAVLDIFKTQTDLVKLSPQRHETSSHPTKCPHHPPPSDHLMYTDKLQTFGLYHRLQHFQTLTILGPRAQAGPLICGAIAAAFAHSRERRLSTW